MSVTPPTASTKLSVIAIALGAAAVPVAIMAGLFGSLVLGPMSFSPIPIRSKMFVVEDEAGNTRIMMTAMADGAPRILLSDQNGTSRAELCLTPLGDPYLIMSSADGRSRLRLSLLGPQRQPELLLLGQDGRTRWRIFLDENDAPKVIKVNGDADVDDP